MKTSERYPVVILAAGQGQRLRRLAGKPKPLTSIFGLTLLERCVLSCREAGARDFYVVVGYQREKITPYVQELARRHRVSIRVVENPDWKEGNGTSVLAVSRYIHGPFLLVMCDHLFDPSILRLLVEADTGDVCLVAADSRVDQVFDLEDATKLRLRGRDVTAIGKTLTSFNAIDTGIFLCRPFLFDALEKARASGDGSLSGGIRELARTGRIRAVDIGDRFWTDVDTPEGLENAKRLLLSGTVKSQDGFISRHFNRPLSQRISSWLARTPVTPNMVTVASFLLALLGALMFTSRGLWTLLAGILVQLSSVLDGCDGEIARLKFQSTRFGAWFDTVLDRYGDAALVLGISYGYWQLHPQLVVWLFGMFALTGFIMYSYTKKEYQLRYGQELSNLYRLAPASRDTRLFLIFIGAMVGHPFIAMVLAGLFAHLAVGLGFLSPDTTLQTTLTSKEGGGGVRGL